MNVYHITYEPHMETAYLYFWGCNFSCRGCIRRKNIYDIHLRAEKYRSNISNLIPSEWLEDPRKASEPLPVKFLSLSEITDVVNDLKPKRVTCLGGEPSIDPDLSDLFAGLKKSFRTYNTLLTNGYRLPVLDAVDEIQISLKAFDNRLHRFFTGKSNSSILKNLRSVYAYGPKLRVESIFIPGLIDEEEIEAIARFIADIDAQIPYRIDAFIPVPGTDWRRPTPQEIEDATSAAGEYLKNVSYLCGKERPRSQIRKIV
ncbi:MAG: radical SAM protein [Thermodesulfobacteriota bacterium]